MVGCFAFWLRRGAAPLVALLGIASLICFAVALTRVDSAFAGRAYAAYGGNLHRGTPPRVLRRATRQRQRFFSEPGISANSATAGTCSPELAGRTPWPYDWRDAGSRLRSGRRHRRAQRSFEPLQTPGRANSMTSRREIAHAGAPARRWTLTPSYDSAQRHDGAVFHRITRGCAGQNQPDQIDGRVHRV